MSSKRGISDDLEREAEMLYDLKLNPDEVEFILRERLKAERRY
jgi:hypothetical protein